jgi:cofilin
MVYASTKGALKKKLDGVAFEVQGTDLSEISQEAILEKARQF